ncbi:CLUMA_CG005568, isoform A [Clunio marinus]|uniref:Protein-S-isoprenylcysteine O-methyltransferase n=1 Tax=Clunio marinus TaxID=568069 RepID=A0A1J1HXB0_9DIPT|nr:CLUMA_CG005568, isoform A [Clunio marinus]
MISRESKFSAVSFILGISTQLFGVSEYGEKIALLLSESFFSSIYALFLLYFIVLVLSLSICFKSKDFQIAIRAGILGYFFGISIYIAFALKDQYKAFGIYGAFLTFFHFSEYFVISITSHQALSLDSFMLTHSVQYGIAATLSWIEFFCEAYFFPDMNEYKSFWIVGSLICLSGEIVRKLAMFTAKKSFHHIVQFQQAEDHKLITNGIYRICRHPSYVGWFYWSIGTQIILTNPFCFIIYIIASWLFFKERVYMEEIALLNFFGEEYLRYQQTTKTGLPFITGYSVSNN